MAFTMRPGWSTYYLPLKGSGLSSAPAAWAGRVVGLRLAGASGPAVKVDWVRLVTPDSGEPYVYVNWRPPASTSVTSSHWEADGVEQCCIGHGMDPTGAFSSRIPVGNRPPGRYRFFVRYQLYDGTAGEMTRWVTVQPRPRPVVLTPSMTQGADWATTVMKNAWDMSQRTDYVLRNARYQGTNGQWFIAQNTTNDPIVGLHVGSGFSGSTYHRVRIKLKLLGEYGLANAPGGGCVGRLLWTTASGGPRNWQTTDDLVVYPGWNTVDLNMTTSPSSAIVDPALGSRRIGWAGQTITGLRFDPNEDPGPRQWQLDEIRVAADPVSSGGRFDLKFVDLMRGPDTTVRVEAVDSSGEARMITDRRPVLVGTNTVTWRPSQSVPAGRYRFRVTVTNGAGSVARWSPIPVTILPA
jgi:hypothetical protein